MAYKQALEAVRNLPEGTAEGPEEQESGMLKPTPVDLRQDPLVR